MAAVYRSREIFLTCAQGHKEILLIAQKFKPTALKTHVCQLIFLY